MSRDGLDGLARRLATPGSRRRILTEAVRGGLGVIMAGILVTRTARSSAAQLCTSDGCGCQTGADGMCDDGLTCCPLSQSFPGPGVCTTHHQCKTGTFCANDGAPCAAYCGWDGRCDSCCSGYCGDYGYCSL